MKKESGSTISDEVTSILCCAFTASELAEHYLNECPSGHIETSIRDEIIQTISVFDRISEKKDLLNAISEAYLYFAEYIFYEDGFFANNMIHDMLLSLEQVHSKTDEILKAVELLNNVPVSVNAKAVLTARTQLLCNTREPIYVKSLQLTNLQMFCLRNPEAIDEVIYLMGQRPFIRETNEKDKPYLQSFIKVLYALITNHIPLTQDDSGMTESELITLIVGILNTFYDEYLSFPPDGYLINLINDSINNS